MPTKDVFLSYASQDVAQARLVVAALESRGYSVWWDREDIPLNRPFDEVIDEAIRGSACVVVLWSERSVQSNFVKAEAAEALRRGVLLQALMDDVNPSLEFRRLQAARLVGWDGAAGDPELAKLLRAVGTLVPIPRRDESSGGISPLSRQDVRSKTHAELPASGKVPSPAVNRPINLGFDGPTAGTMPAGWFNSLGYVSGASIAYACSVVPREHGDGGACVLLQKTDAHEDEFGSLMQRCPAHLLGSATVRFTGEIKTRAVEKWAGLWLRADGEEIPDMLFDNMHRRPIRGNTNWTTYTIDAQLPEGTAWLNYGVVLVGNGQLWADNFRLMIWTNAGKWVDW